MNTNLKLIRFFFKQRQKITLMFSAGSGLILLLYVSIFPTIQKQASLFDTLMKSFPDSLKKAFGISLDLSKLENFLSIKYFAFEWPLLLIILAIGSANSAIATEIDKGTISILHNLPITRARIYWTKYISGILNMLIYILITIALLVPYTMIFKIDVDMLKFIKVGEVGFCFGLAIYSMAFFASALLADPGKVMGSTSSIMIVMYVLNLISSLDDKYTNLKYGSLFYYFDSSKILVNDEVSIRKIGLMLGLAVIFTITGLFVFKRKDINPK